MKTVGGIKVSLVNRSGELGNLQAPPSTASASLPDSRSWYLLLESTNLFTSNVEIGYEVYTGKDTTVKKGVMRFVVNEGETIEKQIAPLINSDELYFIRTSLTWIRVEINDVVSSGKLNWDIERKKPITSNGSIFKDIIRNAIFIFFLVVAIYVIYHKFTDKPGSLHTLSKGLVVSRVNFIRTFAKGKTDKEVITIMQTYEDNNGPEFGFMILKGLTSEEALNREKLGFRVYKVTSAFWQDKYIELTEITDQGRSFGESHKWLLGPSQLSKGDAAYEGQRAELMRMTDYLYEVLPLDIVKIRSLNKAAGKDIDDYNYGMPSVPTWEVDPRTGRFRMVRRKI